MRHNAHAHHERTPLEHCQARPQNRTRHCGFDRSWRPGRSSRQAMFKQSSTGRVDRPLRPKNCLTPCNRYDALRRHAHGQVLNRTSANGRRRAFTIIELVIVILIMSIFAAVAAPAFLDSLLFHRVETAARRVKADIDYARQRARLTSAAQSVTFTERDVHAQRRQELGQPDQDVYRQPADSRRTRSIAPRRTLPARRRFRSTVTARPPAAAPSCSTAKSHQCTVTVNSVTGAATITSNHMRQRRSPAASQRGGV